MREAWDGQDSRIQCRRILWPTDFSECAEKALSHALWLAERYGAELVILHIMTPEEADVAHGITGRIWDRLESESRQRVGAELNRLAERVRGRGLQIRQVLGHGTASREILRAANDLECDLIVIATHGRAGLRRTLMGSVTEKVLRLAPCPVFVVRPETAPQHEDVKVATPG